MLGVVQTIGAAIVDLVARAEHYVHGFGLGALREREQLAVEAQLQYEPGLLAAGQLGVDDFVAPGAETGGALHAAQEVGVANQILVQQRRLIDDRRALPHGGEGLRRQRFGVVRLALDLHDLAVRFIELAEVARLEVMVFALDQLCVVVFVTPQLARLRVFAGGQQRNVSIEMAQALEPVRRRRRVRSNRRARQECARFSHRVLHRASGRGVSRGVLPHHLQGHRFRGADSPAQVEEDLLSSLGIHRGHAAGPAAALEIASRPGECRRRIPDSS